jgi:hypothetical protein
VANALLLDWYGVQLPDGVRVPGELGDEESYNIDVPEVLEEHWRKGGYRGEAAEFQTSRAVTFEATTHQ